MPVVLYGVFAAFCWSIHDIFARNLAARTGPFRMAAWVMAFGGVVLTAVMLAKGITWDMPRNGVLLAYLAGLAYGLGVGSLFRAFSLGPVSLVAPLTATYPVLVFFWAVIMGLAPTALQLAATAMAIGGSILVAKGGGGDGGFAAIERTRITPFLLFCLLCAIGLAASVVAGQLAAPEIGEIEAAWIARPLALAVLLPFLAGAKPMAPLDFRQWRGIAAMAVLDVAGIVAVNAAGRLPGKEFAAVGISAYGAIAVLLARLVLKESVKALQWLGIAFIVAGVGLLSAPA